MQGKRCRAVAGACTPGHVAAVRRCVAGDCQVRRTRLYCTDGRMHHPKIRKREQGTWGQELWENAMATASKARTDVVILGCLEWGRMNDMRRIYRAGAAPGKFQQTPKVALVRGCSRNGRRAAGSWRGADSHVPTRVGTITLTGSGTGMRWWNLRRNNVKQHSSLTGLADADNESALDLRCTPPYPHAACIDAHPW
eukprot:286944-Chlamydomonas_euryale.AAC.6